MYVLTFDFQKEDGIQRKEYTYPLTNQRMQAAKEAVKLMQACPSGKVTLRDVEGKRNLNPAVIIALTRGDDRGTGRYREWLIAEDAATTGLHADCQSLELPTPEIAAIEAGEA